MTLDYLVGDRTSILDGGLPAWRLRSAQSLLRFVVKPKFTPHPNAKLVVDAANNAN
jgi:hypothetical protein